MILEAIELKQHGPKQEKRPFEDPTREPLQVNMCSRRMGVPRIGPTSSDPALDSAIRERLLHGFGNLTLLNAVLNPGVSNGPFRRKRSEIAQRATSDSIVTSNNSRTMISGAKPKSTSVLRCFSRLHSNAGRIR